MIRERQRGFTLIELLITLAVIGIIAGIAIPNLLNALDRGRQKRTMADIRTVGTSVEAYATDQGQYPNVGALNSLVDVAGQLDQYVEPIYTPSCPRTDGWDGALKFGSDTKDYTVRAYAKNKAADASTGGRTTLFTADIIFIDGRFTQWPEGQQQ